MHRRLSGTISRQRLRNLLFYLHMCKSRRTLNLSIRNRMKFRFLNCRLRRIFWVWSLHREASTGLDSNPELCGAGAVLSTKLSYQASWELVVIWGDEPWEKGLIFQHCLSHSRNCAHQTLKIRHIHTYIHTTLFVLAGYKKKAAYADVDLLKTYLKYLQHLIGLILQITLKYL